MMKITHKNTFRPFGILFFSSYFMGYLQLNLFASTDKTAVPSLTVGLFEARLFLICEYLLQELGHPRIRVFPDLSFLLTHHVKHTVEGLVRHVIV